MARRREPPDSVIGPVRLIEPQRSLRFALDCCAPAPGHRAAETPRAQAGPGCRVRTGGDVTRRRGVDRRLSIHARSLTVAAVVIAAVGAGASVANAAPGGAITDVRRSGEGKVTAQFHATQDTPSDIGIAEWRTVVTIAVTGEPCTFDPYGGDWSSDYMSSPGTFDSPPISITVDSTVSRLCLYIEGPREFVALVATAKVPAPPLPAWTRLGGYDWCGWFDFTGRVWRMTPNVDPGVSLILWADGMTCRSARSAYRRIRYPKAHGYRPRLGGYRCRTLRGGDEYADVRCTATTGPSRRFRFKTGA